MSSDQFLDLAVELLEREWRKRNLSFAEIPSQRIIRDAVDVIAANPTRPASELEAVIQRMLVENHFVDDTGDSMVLDACESIECQAHTLVDVLEQVRQQAVRSGAWSTEPLAPIMFG